MYNYSRVRNETTCIYIFHSLCSEGLLSALRHGSTSSLPTEFGALSPAINCGLGSTGTQSPNVCCARNVQHKKKWPSIEGSIIIYTGQFWDGLL